LNEIDPVNFGLTELIQCEIIHVHRTKYCTLGLSIIFTYDPFDEVARKIHGGYKINLSTNLPWFDLFVGESKVRLPVEGRNKSTYEEIES
jgi:hypothetical protein